jgi:hypothetical protein
MAVQDSSAGRDDKVCADSSYPPLRIAECMSTSAMKDNASDLSPCTNASFCWISPLAVSVLTLIFPRREEGIELKFFHIVDTLLWIVDTLSYLGKKITHSALQQGMGGILLPDIFANSLNIGQ